jgi:hypothetical protein
VAADAPGAANGCTPDGTRGAGATHLQPSAEGRNLIGQGPARTATNSSGFTGHPHPTDRTPSANRRTVTTQTGEHPPHPNHDTATAIRITLTNINTTKPNLHIRTNPTNTKTTRDRGEPPDTESTGL